MKIFINDEEKQVKSTNLADLLHEFDYAGEWLATAVNAELVAAEDREKYQLANGDRIEILSPMQGG
ncbi:sulfur carrier protein ThiS [uncultured Bartonella sp.]|uniref:sulfur carrier protein ThiS n=1 Tax=uncultured Bartonella sp. TaxID=104108 RepID=UPI00261E074F|nr:sulfur carrier protein ThiS [uncultured Bartonella sp.]